MFDYQAEKLSEARRALMLPHSSGEEQSIADAFHVCSLGFKDIELPEKAKHLDDSAKDWIKVIKGLMSTDGLTDDDGKGLWAVKAATLSIDDKIQLSRCVDELAHWFDSQTNE
ncbi:hypothetical protein QQM79_01935 [Marinobacteraceae bacterium S3BR75-40.1]